MLGGAGSENYLRRLPFLHPYLVVKVHLVLCGRSYAPIYLVNRENAEFQKPLFAIPQNGRLLTKNILVLHTCQPSQTYREAGDTNQMSRLP